MSRKIGLLAEQHAHDYLMSQGLRWVASNYSCRMGEIDLIMKDKACLVFIEVRKRSSKAFGGALASVTYFKKQKLMKAAMLYLSVNQLHDQQPIRFDVVSVEGSPPDVTWVKNAFGSDF
jgi:putative endonuclease